MNTEIDYVMRDLIEEGETRIKGIASDKTILHVLWTLEEGTVTCRQGAGSIPLHEPDSHKKLGIAYEYCAKYERCKTGHFGCPFSLSWWKEENK